MLLDDKFVYNLVDIYCTNTLFRYSIVCFSKIKYILYLFYIFINLKIKKIGSGIIKGRRNSFCLFIFKSSELSFMVDQVLPITYHVCVNLQKKSISDFKQTLMEMQVIAIQLHFHCSRESRNTKFVYCQQLLSNQMHQTTLLNPIKFYFRRNKTIVIQLCYLLALDILK